MHSSSCGPGVKHRHTMRRLPDSRTGGFTLIELLITVAIVAILVAAGVIGFGALLDNSRTRQVSDSLRAAIAQSRSEAITRGGAVRFCASDNGSTCANSFDDGWIIYHDIDNDAALTGADRVLTWHEEEHRSLTIASTDPLGLAVANFGFNYRGYPTTVVNMVVASGNSSNSVQLFANGRVSVQ